MKSNFWIRKRNVRQIELEMWSLYYGVEYRKEDGTSMEKEILDFLAYHPLYSPEMWLEIEWDEYDCVENITLHPE